MLIVSIKYCHKNSYNYYQNDEFDDITKKNMKKHNTN